MAAVAKRTNGRTVDGKHRQDGRWVDSDLECFNPQECDRGGRCD